MRDTLNQYLKKFNENSRKHKKVISVFVMLALIVAVGVTWRLKLTGVSMTNEVYCGKEEHIHTAECYRIVEASSVTENDVIVAYSTQANMTDGEGLEAANADDSNINGDVTAVNASVTDVNGTVGDSEIPEGYVKILVCGKEEHIHTILCMSDETADIEDEEYWHDLIKVLNLNGESYADDLLTIAGSQIGYSESIRNFVLNDNETSKNGTTRYGQWYGNSYGNWNGMFVAFCLNYAGVSSDMIPYNAGVGAWVVDLTKAELYKNAGEYTPVAGDIAFVDSDGDGTADDVGIVSEISYDENDGVTITEILLIQGDVKETSEAADDDETPDSVQVVRYEQGTQVIAVAAGTEIDENGNVINDGDSIVNAEDTIQQDDSLYISNIVGYVSIPVKEVAESVDEDAQVAVNENELQYYAVKRKKYNALPSVASGYKRIYFDAVNLSEFFKEEGGKAYYHYQKSDSTWTDLKPMELVYDNLWIYYCDIESDYQNIQFLRSPNGTTSWGYTEKISSTTIGDNNYYRAKKTSTGNAWSTTDQNKNGYWLKVVEEDYYLDASAVTTYDGTIPYMIFRNTLEGTTSGDNLDVNVGIYRYEMENIGGGIYSTTALVPEDASNPYKYTWFTTSATGWTNQTSDNTLVRERGTKNLFTMYSSTDGDGHYTGTWSYYSVAGSNLYIVNMSDSTFTLKYYYAIDESGTGKTVEESHSIVAGGSFQTEIPADDDSLGAYRYIFINGEAYQVINNIKDGKVYYYYAATEKNYSDVNNKEIISYWGIANSATSDIAEKTLYFDQYEFLESGSAPIVTIKGSNVTVTKTSDGDGYQCIIPAGITQEDIITVTYNNSKYRFYWSNIDDYDMVGITSDIAGVLRKYTALSPYIIYFDATYSKLQYSGTGEYSNYSLPMDGQNVYYRAWVDPDLTDSDSGFDTATIKKDGQMFLMSEREVNGRKWKNVWAADLGDGQYTNIIFYTASGIITNDFPNPSWTAGKSRFTDKDNAYSKINWASGKVCFYADTSDKSLYDNELRQGYWNRPFTLIDSQANKAGADVNPIATGSFDEEADTGTVNVFYMNSTIYDYYSDYELNGNTRASYIESTGGSHRNYVNFRQFDQALSDYYGDSSVKYTSAIYTGHFQPNIYNGSKFSEIAGTLGLYGWSEYNTFMAVNNSNLDIGGNKGKYDSAAVGIVDDKLSNDKNLTISTQTSGNVLEPHFNADFLLGDNSKNAVLGEVFEKVAFPFVETQVFEGDASKYYWFDSARTTLQLKQNTKSDSKFKYYLDGEPYYGNVDETDTRQKWALNVNYAGNVTGSQDAISRKYGFFPFNNVIGNQNGNCASKYNYGFGAKLEFSFTITDNGTMDNSSNGKPIIFRFSGDDDVWVYVDDQLVLDLGGGHGQVQGMIDFSGTGQEKKAYISQIKDIGSGAYSEWKLLLGDDKKTLNYLYGEAKGDTVNVIYYPEHANGNKLTVTEEYNYEKKFNIKGSNKDTHTIKVYYMERGLWESNFSMVFNFPTVGSVEPEKYTLPQTGGSGTNLLIYSGIAILLLGCLYYRCVFKQFNEERRKV